MHYYFIKYFIFINCFTFHSVELIYGSTTKNLDSCIGEIYQRSQTLICSNLQKNRSSWSKKVKSTCSAKESRKFFAEGDKLVSVQKLDFRNCPLKSRVFEFLNMSRIHYFKSSSENTVLQNYTFYGLCKLKYMDLSGNHILDIQSKAFYCLNDVTEILLSSNIIEFLSNGVFEGMRYLSKLSLDLNYIHSIEKGTFDGLVSLEFLDLTRNSIVQLPETIFHHLTALEILNLDLNRLVYLRHHTQSNLTDIENKNHSKSLSTFMNNQNLQELRLNYNLGIYLAANSLEGLIELRKLYLEGCNITFLRRGMFLNTPTLSHLYLYHNHLQTITDEFRSLPLLQHLDISLNSIIKIGDNSFDGMPKLRKLHMEKNAISSLCGSNQFQSLFSSLTSLTYLDISNNAGLILFNTSFVGLEKLKKLYMIRCNLASFPSGLFLNTRKLLVISAFGNKFSEIKWEDFQGLSSLKYLDISKNSIATIANNSFHDLPHLEYLSISHNLLSFLPAILFEYNTKLNFVDVSHNNLTDVGGENWKYLKDLTAFIAQNNQIEELFLERFLPAAKELTIYLQKNKVRRIHVPKNIQSDAFISSGVKVNIDLQDNQLECDCYAYEFYRYLNDSRYLPHIEFINELICKHPVEQMGKKLNELDPSAFTCSITDFCPNGCNCTYRSHDSKLSLNCTNKSHQYLPSRAPPNTNILYISGNNLTSLLGLSESIWENLTELHAADNEIPSEEFYVPKNIKFLGLRGNNLKSLPRTILNHAQMMKDVKMTLSDNLWPCDCSTLTFKKWLSEQVTQVVDADNVRCIFLNSSVSTVSLRVMQDSELCPQSYLFVYLINFLVLILLSSIVAYHKYKLHILFLMYSHCNCCYKLFCCGRQSTEEKLFDCFISYSSEDGEVTRAILGELEEKPPHFKFCIHERNWVPGRHITNNIIISVQNSRKTLIVISDTFLKSEWFYMEFQAAYHQTLQDKRDRMIIILKGALPDKSELQEDVKYVISRKTYLQWGEKWFWEKLRYAIHEDNFFTMQKNKLSFRNILNCFTEKDECQQDISLNEDVS